MIEFNMWVLIALVVIVTPGYVMAYLSNRVLDKAIKALTSPVLPQGDLKMILPTGTMEKLEKQLRGEKNGEGNTDDSIPAAKHGQYL